MFYTWNFTLPTGRTALTRTKQILPLERGTIVKCETVFPSGCCGLVYVHLNHSLHQVYPKNPDYQYVGNGETIVAGDEYEVKDEPYQLEFYGWNTDDTYLHTITIRIQLVPKREIIRLALSEIMRLGNLKKPI